jgi:hypothetical protein
MERRQERKAGKLAEAERRDDFSGQAEAGGAREGKGLAIVRFYVLKRRVNI